MNTASKNGFLFGLLMPGDLRAKESVEWETLFDGEFTTNTQVNNITAGTYYESENVETNFALASGGRYRLTVDGVSYVFNAAEGTNYTYIGNQALTGSLLIDDGYDVAFLTLNTKFPIIARLASRTSGTHKVTIEKDVCVEGKGMAYYNAGDAIFPIPPEYNDELYPYAIIWYSEYQDRAHFCISAEPFTVDGENLILNPRVVYSIARGDVDWGDGGTVSTSSTILISRLLWSNHDIINTTDGTVYLAASDPMEVT